MENKPWVEVLAERCQPGPGEVTVPAVFTWEREAKGGAATHAKPNSLGKRLRSWASLRHHSYRVQQGGTQERSLSSPGRKWQRAQTPESL